jgi:hypothetical protein
MALSETQHGHAVLWGIGANSVAISGYAAVLAISAKVSHKIKMDSVEDERGEDATLVATNSMIEADIAFIPENGTLDFPAPLESITLSGFNAAQLNGQWLYIGDAAIDLSHKEGKMTFKARKYTDPEQNSLLQT